MKRLLLHSIYYKYRGNISSRFSNTFSIKSWNHVSLVIHAWYIFTSLSPWKRGILMANYIKSFVHSSEFLSKHFLLKNLKEMLPLNCMLSSMVIMFKYSTTHCRCEWVNIRTILKIECALDDLNIGPNQHLLWNDFKLLKLPIWS